MKTIKHDLLKLREELAEKYEDKKYLEMDRYDLGAIYYDWHPKAVENLRKLITTTNAEIVLSSSWRYYNTLPVLKKYFRIHNLDQYITGATHTEGSCRVGQIRDYLNENKDIEQFVVIDDLNLSEDFPDNFVYTYEPDYLNDGKFQEALKILGNS